MDFADLLNAFGQFKETATFGNPELSEDVIVLRGIDSLSFGEDLAEATESVLYASLTTGLTQGAEVALAPSNTTFELVAAESRPIGDFIRFSLRAVSSP